MRAQRPSNGKEDGAQVGRRGFARHQKAQPPHKDVVIDVVTVVYLLKLQNIYGNNGVNNFSSRATLSGLLTRSIGLA